MYKQSHYNSFFVLEHVLYIVVNGQWSRPKFHSLLTYSSLCAAIVVDFHPTEYRVSEDNTSVTVFLKASLAASNEYTVTVATQDGTAVGK